MVDFSATLPREQGCWIQSSNGDSILDLFLHFNQNENATGEFRISHARHGL